MTTFAQLAKGGQQGEGITLEPGKPDESYLVELIRPDGEPRMPYKQDPLPPTRSLHRALGDGGGEVRRHQPGEDWTFLLRKTQTVTIPEAYPVTVPITALAFSPDGQQIAASGYHEITLWKTPTARSTAALPGSAERIYDIAYSPDGKWMATASGDPGQFGVARLWLPGPAAAASRSATWSRARTSSSPSPSAPTARSSPPPAPTGPSGSSRSRPGKLLAQIEDHADWIFDIAFSPDGKRLASASRDKTSKVFDVEKKESLVTFPGHAQTGLHRRVQRPTARPSPPAARTT